MTAVNDESIAGLTQNSLQIVIELCARFILADCGLRLLTNPTSDDEVSLGNGLYYCRCFKGNYLKFIVLPYSSTKL